MSMTEETIDSIEKGTLDTNETKAETGDHGDFNRATYGLSQLSCSTANNEDFYIVHHTDDESRETRKETEPKHFHPLASAYDEVPMRSVAAQTSICTNSENFPTTPYLPFGLVREYPPPNMVYREINRIPNAHIRQLMTNAQPFPYSKNDVPMLSAPNFAMNRSPTMAVENSMTNNMQHEGDSASRSNTRRYNSHVESNAFHGSSRSISNNSRRYVMSKSIFNSTPKGQYPMMYVSEHGIISLVISDDILIETGIDRTLRVVSHGNFAMTMNSRGTASAVEHPLAKIIHGTTKISARFVAFNNKFTVLDSEAILFTMGHLQSGFLIRSNDPKKVPVEIPMSIELLKCFNLNQDYTQHVFYNEAPEDVNAQRLEVCYDIIHKATFEYLEDGALRMNIHGMVITSCPNGDLRIDSRPRVITCNPKKGTLMLRSPLIDIGVDEDEKAYVKRGSKRVHVSKSGMVVSDGNCVTSMDHYGRIISCT
ncbi:unnamed protein product, partial [Mesorhabditis belari]|uniref:Uncharacterized protein n=1 Tax=Mesorhabditis belari TaxID=2138241 RepID=A0AAF3ELX2_9BILA